VSAPVPVPPPAHDRAPADEPPPRPPQSVQPPEPVKELPTLEELTQIADRLSADIQAHQARLRGSPPDARP
jgi:hypothetical protein